MQRFLGTSFNLCEYWHSRFEITFTEQCHHLPLRPPPSSDDCSFHSRLCVSHPHHNAPARTVLTRALIRQISISHTWKGMSWSRTGVACSPLLVSPPSTTPTLPPQFFQLSAVLHTSLKFCNAVINILYSMRARCLLLGKI